MYLHHKATVAYLGSRGHVANSIMVPASYVRWEMADYQLLSSLAAALACVDWTGKYGDVHPIGVFGQGTDQIVYRHRRPTGELPTDAAPLPYVNHVKPVALLRP